MQDCFSHSYLFLSCRQACCFEWDETKVHGNEMALTGSRGRHNGICPPPFAKDHLPLLTFGHDLFAKCQEQCRTSQQWSDVIQFAGLFFVEASFSFWSPSTSTKVKGVSDIDLGRVGSCTWRNLWQHLDFTNVAHFPFWMTCCQKLYWTSPPLPSSKWCQCQVAPSSNRPPIGQLQIYHTDSGR